MFIQPELAYPYNSLEPHIDELTMKIHHGKHHAGYTKKLNIAIEKHPELFDKTIEDILSNLDNVPKDIRTTVRNNGGGYYHHNLYFEMISPNGGGEATGSIAEAINNTFGSFAEFNEKFSAEAATHFGSGWTWLVKDDSENLSIMSTPNQDSPLSQGLKPVLVIDSWEHAYYLNYQNRRPDYIKSWWNVINWKAVNKYLNT